MQTYPHKSLETLKNWCPEELSNTLIKVIEVNGGFEDKSYSIIIFLTKVWIKKWLIRPLAETRKIL